MWCSVEVSSAVLSNGSDLGSYRSALASIATAREGHEVLRALQPTRCRGLESIIELFELQLTNRTER